MLQWTGSGAVVVVISTFSASPLCQTISIVQWLLRQGLEIPDCNILENVTIYLKSGTYLRPAPLVSHCTILTWSDTVEKQRKVDITTTTAPTTGPLQPSHSPRNTFQDYLSIPGLGTVHNTVQPRIPPRTDPLLQEGPLTVLTGLTQWRSRERDIITHYCTHYRSTATSHVPEYLQDYLPIPGQGTVPI